MFVLKLINTWQEEATQPKLIFLKSFARFFFFNLSKNDQSGFGGDLKRKDRGMMNLKESKRKRRKRINQIKRFLT